MRKVSIFGVSKDQIIRTSTEEQRWTELNVRSFSNLEYGKGKLNYCDFQGLTKLNEKRLVTDKVFLDWDSQLKFQFSNINNLFELFDNIYSKVPQEKYIGINTIFQ